MSVYRSIRPALLLSGAVSLLALSAAAPAISQELLDIGEVVVTPNRTPTEKSKVGSTVHTVDEETIEAQSRPLVVDYLNQIPGVAIASQGGAGKITTFFMRGAPGEYVKTLVNGIDVSDVSYTKVQPHFGQFLAGGVNRIEVLKGSQSTLYGSDAIAGVVDVSTFGEVESGVRHRVLAEGGSYGTFLGGYSVDGGFDRGQFGLSFLGQRSDGFSAAAAGTEDDGYENVTATFGGRYDLSETVSVFGSGLLIHGDTEFDDAFPPPDFVVNDSDAESTFRQAAGRVGVDFLLLDGRLSNTISAQLSDIHRENADSFGFNTFDGRRAKLDYLGSFTATPELTLNFGGDWEHQQADNSNQIDEEVSLGGGWVDAIYNPIDPLTITLGGRHDQHSIFGGHTTWRATGSYQFSQTGTRIHSAFGTGYRAPSLYELYAPVYGNSALGPETSLSFDIGVEQRFLDGRAVADLTFFMLDIDDYIQYDFASNRYQQLGGTVRTRGVEASLAFAATDWLDLQGTYTYTKATLPDGTRQVRIPRHDIGLSLVAQPAEKWTISATANIALDAVDFEGIGKAPLDDYVLVNAKVAYKPTDDTELYLRVENLLDQDYETVRGYATPGFSAFAGFKAVF